MSYLLDTNCWMQLVRAREHAADVRDLLAALPPDQVSITDFALYSIALAMRRHKVLDQFPAFVRLSGIGQGVRLIRLEPGDLIRVVETGRSYQLDFDDAFQYTASELRDLVLVSFDADFDRTPRGRLTPQAALQRFQF
jgi:predicted nucleic acid-binding protein